MPSSTWGSGFVIGGGAGLAVGGITGFALTGFTAGSLFGVVSVGSADDVACGAGPAGRGLRTPRAGRTWDSSGGVPEGEWVASPIGDSDAGISVGDAIFGRVLCGTALGAGLEDGVARCPASGGGAATFVAGAPFVPEGLPERHWPLMRSTRSAAPATTITTAAIPIHPCERRGGGGASITREGRGRDGRGVARGEAGVGGDGARGETWASGDGVGGKAMDSGSGMPFPRRGAVGS